ncbi:MAG: type II toxin-antitoxin system RelE/ParE family toxin [Gammaproteobacteria bacterium]
MTWTIKFDDRAKKEFKRLDKHTQRTIIRYLRERIESSNNPRQYGKSLSANKTGLWRYRIGDYRLVCAIQDNELVVLVLRVTHRRHVYDD